MAKFEEASFQVSESSKSKSTPPSSECTIDGIDQIELKHISVIEPPAIISTSPAKTTPKQSKMDDCFP
eukprot:CAMPEP_0202450976 /NCGR_PEP_ID=MMETSP1360-20130828/9505_1 /ASSEMBLY_ACC=CAM_ASM_000848 /TAXON_ID=515479 /ORGANISM="Licmophora paradoxa, Strain CCMP2313" /LENGTH=67 /DNA_ID=CAMNT_0049069431 /DNA_START=59 /DNA_END=259 /DNA_ORIENTATION=-